MNDVIVVGGGIIGLSIARELAISGRSVLLLERASETGEGASWAAAGMLAPQSEALEDNLFFQMCVESHRIYSSWAAAIGEESGIDPGYAPTGLLFLAPSDRELAEVGRRFAWQRSFGLKLESLTTAQARELEPAVTMPIAGAFLMPDEHHIAPRKLADALRTACVTRNVKICTGRRVDEVVASGDKVRGVRMGAEVEESPWVVIASGAWTGEIKGLHPRIPIVPRKGQILSLTMPGPTFRRIIRWGHNYAVPRADGELVVGATNEDAGFDRNLTPAGVGQLLNAVQELSTAASTYPIREMWTGLRPAAPDGLPVLGGGALHGLIYATGHYRNGVLLAPITASFVRASIEGRTFQLALEPFSPARFEV